MPRDEILKSLALNPKLKQVARNIAGSKGLADDLYQHLFLVLCEYPTDKIESYPVQYLEFLCVKIMSNSYHGARSLFTKEYQHHQTNAELPPMPEIDNEELINEKIELDKKIMPLDNFLQQDITQDNFYKLTLIKLWNDGNSYREISRKTKIPVMSIAKSIQTTLKELKEQCR